MVPLDRLALMAYQEKEDNKENHLQEPLSVLRRLGLSDNMRTFSNLKVLGRGLE